MNKRNVTFEQYYFQSRGHQSSKDMRRSSVDLEKIYTRGGFLIGVPFDSENGREMANRPP
jgi:hypothetical protein